MNGLFQQNQNPQQAQSAPMQQGGYDSILNQRTGGAGAGGLSTGLGAGLGGFGSMQGGFGGGGGMPFNVSGYGGMNAGLGGMGGYGGFDGGMGGYGGFGGGMGGYGGYGSFGGFSPMMGMGLGSFGGFGGYGGFNPMMGGYGGFGGFDGGMGGYGGFGGFNPMMGGYGGGFGGFNQMMGGNYGGFGGQYNNFTPSQELPRQPPQLMDLSQQPGGIRGSVGEPFRPQQPVPQLSQQDMQDSINSRALMDFAAEQGISAPISSTGPLSAEDARAKRNYELEDIRNRLKEKNINFDDAALSPFKKKYEDEYAAMNKAKAPPEPVRQLPGTRGLDMQNLFGGFGQQQQAQQQLQALMAQRGGMQPPRGMMRNPNYDAGYAMQDNVDLPGSPGYMKWQALI